MFGLDVCRTIAVLFVVTGHLLQHSTPHPFLASLGFVGLFGVDLFFCLSGFLIGRILLQESQRWPDEEEEGLLRFWYRRWMRTLPLYFFFFIVSLKFDWTGATTVSSRLSYFVFAQNLVWPMPDFYGLTWSLAVEEWFYFSFPLILLMLIGLGKSPRHAAIISIACFVLIPPLVRLILPGNFYDYQSLDEGIRHVMIFRLDSIGFGVLVAYIGQWHDEIFQRLVKLWWFFLGLVIACMTCTRMGYFGLSESRIIAPLYFSISALAFAGLIPFFSSLTPGSSKLLNRFVKYTSLISYSMYLAHIFAFMIGMAIFRQFGIFDSAYPNPWLTYPSFYALVYLLSSLTYFLIEKPVLAIRDRQSGVRLNRLRHTQIGT
ncbi:MAG: acyltransferase [Proteobacteria bacterium]|nr:acyltransferase [Pseudomonadota bacterium]